MEDGDGRKGARGRAGREQGEGVRKRRCGGGIGRPGEGVEEGRGLRKGTCEEGTYAWT